MVVLLGTLSAIVYGASDFVGGYASRDLPPARVTLGVYLFSATPIVPALAVGTAVWSPAAVMAGLVGGIFGSVGTRLFYGALAAGPVGFVAPVVAALGAAVPCIYAIGHGEPFSLWIAVALVGVVVAGLLIGFEPDVSRRPSRGVVAMSVAGGVAFGCYFIAMASSPRDSGVVPLLIDLGCGSLVAVALAVPSRAGRGCRLHSRDTVLIAIAGASQGIGDVLLIFGLHLPGLAVVTALSALYPIGTVTLGAVVLRERMRPMQYAGVLIAVGGIVVLSLAAPAS